MLITCPHCLSSNRVPQDRLGDDPSCGHCGKELLTGKPVELTDASFAAVTGKTELPVVIDVWAEWCGPCRMMAPQFEKAAQQLKGQALLAKLDSDENPRTSGALRIRGIPTMVAFRAGSELGRVSGAMSAAQIVQWIAQVSAA